ncbi:MAG: hypothetical protein EP318_21360 [Rhodobacteraceae bacterium]|nr:MAG: hypothetical protein EP318_21360 [Paracoccaceae bacterium]
MTESFCKVLGHGRYEAHWVDRTSLVRLSACGQLPCARGFAQFEMRGERVSPPLWNFVFYLARPWQSGLRMFDHSVCMLNATGSDTVIVHDAAGMNEVPIRSQAAPVAEPGADFVVQARFPVPKNGHSGCVIVPAEALLPAQFYRAYGPARHDACAGFVAQHDTGAAPAPMGGEIPWPLVV